jgi:hypothetical protein
MIIWIYEMDSFPICNQCHSSIYFEELPISLRMKNKQGYYGGSMGIPAFCVLPKFALCKIKCLWDCNHEKEIAIVPRGHKKIFQNNNIINIGRKNEQNRGRRNR